MRHLPATRRLTQLALATFCAVTFVALNVSPCPAQAAPTLSATAPAPDPQPWQPQIEALSEQLASLRQQLDELKSRPTPDAELEIKRLDEKIDLLQALLSKPDAPGKADLDSLRDFLSLQDNLVERQAVGEIVRIDEKVDYFRETLIDRMNNYVWAFGIIGATIVALATFFGRKTLTTWIKQRIAFTTEKKISEYIETKFKEQGEKAITQLLEEFRKRLQEELGKIADLRNKVEHLLPDVLAQSSEKAPTAEVKASLESVVREISETKKPSEYTAEEWYLKGAKAYWDDNWEEAVTCLSASIEKNPDDANTYYNRGASLAKLKRYESAVTDYTKAIEFEPSNAIAYGNRGAALAELEYHEDALVDYKKALELKPDYVLAYLNAAEVQTVTNQPDSALIYLDSVKPLIREALHRAVGAYLTCIATAQVEEDRTEADDKFANAIKEKFKNTWSTDIIERWLEKAELDEGVRKYIREKTEEFKKHK